MSERKKVKKEGERKKIGKGKQERDGGLKREKRARGEKRKKGKLNYGLNIYIINGSDFHAIRCLRRFYFIKNYIGEGDRIGPLNFFFCESIFLEKSCFFLNTNVVFFY